MTVDCSRTFQARAVVAPLECRTVAGPFKSAVLLTDVVFELNDHPNGFQSKACGFVWNALPNQWSRLLLGGHVDDAGRRYHLETGLLCPQGSYLSVCTCLFVSQPTSSLWAVLSGYACHESHVDVTGVEATGGLHTIDWTDVQAAALDPHDPTGVGAAARGLPERELLGTAREHVDPGEFVLHGAEGRSLLPRGATTAVRTESHDVTWQSGREDGSSRLPEGTNLVVARRSADGRSIHWLCYRETQAAAG